MLEKSVEITIPAESIPDGYKLLSAADALLH